MSIKKAPKRLLEVFVRQKLLPLLFFVRFFCFVSWFGLICVFVHLKFFGKKKNKQVWNCLDNPIYYTTDVYPYQPTYWECISTPSFLFEIIWESLLFMRIFLNPYLWESLLIYDHLWESVFLSLYENKQAYEYHHLKQNFYHQNTIMIFCWFHMFQGYVFILNSFHFVSDYLFIK